MKDNIIRFKKQKLFKNASLINLESGQVDLVDILVEDDKISRIEPSIEDVFYDVEDLEGNLVLPPFANMFCDSDEALKSTYNLEIDGEINVGETVKFDNFFKVYGGTGLKSDTFMKINNFVMMKLKNYLAGAVFVNDLAQNEYSDHRFELLQNIQDLDEKQLDALCQKFHTNWTLPFLKVGQTLEELGTLDKMYKKPLPLVLEDFGFLDFSPAIIGGNCFEKDELETLEQYGCTFVVTPFDDGKEGRRPTNLIRLKNMDFTICLGSGNAFEIDFFEYMRIMVMQMRSMFESKDVFSEKDALVIALAANKSLCVGDVASFIVVKNDLSLYDDIYKTLVWGKTNADLVMTVDCGEVVVKNGKIAIQEVPNYDRLKYITKLFTRRNKEDDN